MEDHDIRLSIEAELSDARESRAQGKEGRARVCARRAAGLALGHYYERCLGKPAPASAYQLLQWFSQRKETPEELRETARRLIVRVTPEYKLPHSEDPLEDAQSLIMAILDGTI